MGIGQSEAREFVIEGLLVDPHIVEFTSLVVFVTLSAGFPERFQAI